MKDCTTCKYGYEDERLGIPMCHHPKRFSEDCVDFNMHEEKHPDGKPNKSLEEEIETVWGEYECYNENYDKVAELNWSEFNKVIKHFYGLGQSQMPMPEDTVLFQKGVAEGRRLEREDMMKDAIEGYVNYYEDSGGILMAEAQVGCPYHNGDKVRIIVVKDESK